LKFPRRTSAHSNVAGAEKGLSASTTNITLERRSVDPLLETYIGMSAPWPAMDHPAPIRETP
jgi:hypothetical protein